MPRAYSLLEIKAIDAERRVFTGMATTPDLDRQGDVVDPAGVQFKNPLPLLLHHDAKLPVGRVTFHPATAAGIAFTAEIPAVDSPGKVKDRVDEAWDSIKAGLITGVSIGYVLLDNAVEHLKNGTRRLLKIEVGELSLVTIPANRAATIHTVKELDLAASGRYTPGVTGLPIVHAVKAATPMTTQDQITQFENTRAAKAARMTDLMADVAKEGKTLDDAQTQEYDGLALEVKSVDAHLVRLREQEQLTIKAATKITAKTPEQAAAERGGNVPVIQVKSMLPKGTAFTRYAMATVCGKGDYMRTLEHAKQWHDSTPEVELMVKGAIAAGTTTDATWAGPLVLTNPVNEFLELLRPRTIIGRVPGFRQVPFNVSVPTVTAGGTYGWVGQGAPKPVTNMQFATTLVPFAKAAGIIVITEELAKLSTPSAEATVREEMIAGMAQFLDGQLITPAVAAVANVSPASITNGAGSAAASGVTAAAAKLDLAAAVATFTAAGIPLDGAVWIMSDSNAWGLSQAFHVSGQPLFPGIGMDGGTLFGRPVIISNTAAALVILVHAPSILFADEGGTRIDVSREASIQMDSAPTNPPVDATVMVSMFQNNLIALRVERMITWIRARTAAVRVITAAAYTGA